VHLTELSAFLYIPRAAAVTLHAVTLDRAQQRETHMPLAASSAAYEFVAPEGSERPSPRACPCMY
jgi:hypothetical protein